MAARAFFDAHPQATMIGASAAILICVVAIILEAHTPSPPDALHGLYFTVDDGKSYFVDDPMKVPPYDHDGKQAVKCHVFQTPSGKQVVYLEKLTDAARKIVLDNQAHPNPGAGAIGMEVHNSVLVKKPGDKDWVPENSAAGTHIVDSGPDSTEITP